jgi:hAT family dimerisation domain.
LRQFKRRDPPFDSDYDSTPFKWWLTYEESEEMPLVSLAIKLYSITPSEAGCERNFSVLKWFYGDRRTNLDIRRIELMSMMRSFWITNVEKEIAYYGKELTADDLRHCTQISTVVDDEFDEYDFDDIDDPESPDHAFKSTLLNISSIVNLDDTTFNNGDQVIQPDLNRNSVPDNLEYSVNDLVSHFLNEHDV